MNEVIDLLQKWYMVYIIFKNIKKK
jgi:hypothetical protein